MNAIIMNLVIVVNKKCNLSETMQIRELLQYVCHMNDGTKNHTGKLLTIHCI